MCVRVLGERPVGIILVFLYELLQSKGKGNMQWMQGHTTFHHTNSVNSLIMYDMEIMIKISFVITLMLTSIIIIDFDYFQMSL